MKTIWNLKSWLFIACIPVLSACAGSGSSSPVGPGVRVVNGLTSAVPASVTVGTIAVANSLLYAQLSGTPHSPYSIIPTGNQTVSLAAAATPSSPVASVGVNLTTLQDVDAIAYNPAAPTFLVLYDNLTIPTTTQVRLVNCSSVAGSVDVFLSPSGAVAGSPITLPVGSVSPTQPTGTSAYTTVTTTGAYTLTVYPAGHDSGTPLMQEVVNLPSGVSYTFIILDPQTGQNGVTVLEVQDSQLHDSAP